MKPKYHVVSFSGGKDSTAMLLRMIEENMQIDEILFCDTGLEFPEMYDHVKKVEEYIGRPITKLKAEKDFMYWAAEHEFTTNSGKIKGYPKGSTVKGYGYPSMRLRWCTRSLKIDIINKHLTELNKKYEVCQYIGIAADEQHRKKEFNYPLIDWNMTEADCIQYCKERGFDFGGLYEIWSRVSCWCCPLQGTDSMRKLKTHRPQLWDELKKIDDALKNSGQQMIQFGRASFTDISNRFEVEDEFVAQGKKLRTKEFFNELKRRGIKYI